MFFLLFFFDCLIFKIVWFVYIFFITTTHCFNPYLDSITIKSQYFGRPILFVFCCYLSYAVECFQF